MVAAHHFTFNVNGSEVVVEVAPEASIRVESAGGAKDFVLKGGEHRVLCVGDRLWIGQMIVDVTGLSVRQDAGVSFARRDPAKTRIWPTLMCCSGLTLLGVWLLSSISESSGGVNSSGENYATPTIPTAIEASDVIGISSRQNVLDEFSYVSLSPFELQWRKGKWRAKLYVTHQSERADVIYKISNFPFAIDALVYSDQELKRVAETVLSSLGFSLDVCVEKGIIKLSGINRQYRDKLRRDLIADIPGLREVTFKNSAGRELTSAEFGVVALWNGERPYVVTADNRIVRVGEIITTGVKLAQVRSDYVVIDFHGEFKKVSIL
ncbi:hypothetical protein [Ochrobactrum sp. Marseille-Q0166]|uniref:SctD/MshK family protein n=1 Tax=Ochrobactrum sp. Marseille-Q0166 TaxID=2761105 RepID=UPI0016557591|nr:hypothetical protein [Ochrobactrum sp. Marseille-Q0166]MBC8719588.1 hypothetical protein [Ochrobactrum sp. Marseille-Q0166]